MKPGRELDALIAEKVMEWHQLGDDWGYQRNRVANHDWSPSTDIAAAWTVVEKLINPWTFMLEKDHATEWYFKAWFGNNNAESQTTPHAICLAALKAVGHEITEK